ncbi:MAG: MgtC/SapB family protein [Ruminococcaceae bacterium]|nr:MgtC/SapB family protein [Oscillospiraceae bacterium]
MLECLNFLRGTSLDWISVTVRLVLAVICGGIIGIERERKRRPAGFRTHILICLGAAMTTLTSQFLVLEMGLFTDMARLGAQVIAGIGFIGAGTIIITKRRQVKGLTTAAGLWTAAIVGLCCGAGYVEGALATTLVIILAELVFARLEYFIVSNARTFNLYVEYTDSGNLGSIIDTVKRKGGYIVDMEITKNAAEGRNPCVIFSLSTPRKTSLQALMTVIAKLDGVVSVEEL